MKLPALGVLALLATTAPLVAQDMTDAERTTFRAEVRAYLLENPEVLIEAMTALEAKQQTEQANRNSPSRFGSHAKGP